MQKKIKFETICEKLNSIEFSTETLKCNTIFFFHKFYISKCLACDRKVQKKKQYHIFCGG